MKCITIEEKDGKQKIDIVKKETIKFRDSKKERIKATRKEVNKFDESFGIDIKHPKDEMDSEYLYSELAFRYRYLLNRLIYLMNNVDTPEKLKIDTIFGTELKPVKIKKIKPDSKFFDSENGNLTSEYAYRVRFLTYMIKYISDNIETIVKKCFDVNGKMVFVEYETKLTYLDSLTMNLCELITSMLQRKNYRDNLLYMSDISMIEHWKNKKSLNKIEKISENLQWVHDNAGIRISDKPVMIDTLCKIAYLMTVECKNAKNAVTFNPNGDFKSKNTMMTVSELGESIKRKLKNRDINPVFQSYIKSNPKIYVRWRIAKEDENVRIGAFALNYLAFVANDAKITRVVNKILQ